MRHRVKTKKFNLKRNARIGLMKGLASALLEREAITTTAAKAKALRPYVEKLITIAKKDTVAGTRLIMARIGNNKGSKSLVKNASTVFADRVGGYTRIVKLPKRVKDASPMAMIQLIK